MSVKPESVGMSSERLQRIDRFLAERYLEPGRMAHFQTTVLRRGKIVHQSSQGLADRERGRPLEDDAIFRIYSMTKPITSLAFMMLVEEGKVALDDPVHRFIPEWRNIGVYEAGFIGSFQTRRTNAPMRMVDLLRHTSGLTYGFQQRTNVDAAYRRLGVGEITGSMSLEAMIQTLATIPLEHSPGEAWIYSVATDVLGYLVGKISGEPFEDFIRKRIFEPLGMVDTDFHVAPEKAHRLAACYNVAPGGGMVLQDDPETSPFLKKPAFISGGGGLTSTTADYLQFVRMLLNGGELDGHRLIGPKTLQLMTANHLPGGRDLTQISKSLFSETSNSGTGFGLGFAVNIDPVRSTLAGTVGEYYWGGAATTTFWVDPAEDLAVISMTQLLPSTAYPIRRELRTLVYAALTETA